MSEWFESYGFAEVFPELMIGAYPLDSDDVEALASGGVRHVLNLAQDAEYQEGQRREVEAALARHRIQEVRLSVVDFGHLPADPLDQAVGTVVGWMDACERSYVHCRAGWQRSAAVAAAAVAVFSGVDISTALDWVRRHKSTASPLPHQQVDLLDWWLTRGRLEAEAHAAAEARSALDTGSDPAVARGATETGGDPATETRTAIRASAGPAEAASAPAPLQARSA